MFLLFCLLCVVCCVLFVVCCLLFFVLLLPLPPSPLPTPSCEIRVVDHAAAYETIHPNEAMPAWTTLTKPLPTAEVRPTYIHKAPHAGHDSTRSEYEKFIEFHNKKRKKLVPARVKSIIERDCEDVFSWLSQQHGMWITHIEMEYMCEATAVATTNLYTERNAHKGKCYLKAINFVEYVKCATSRPDAMGGIPSTLPMTTMRSSGGGSGGGFSGLGGFGGFGGGGTKKTKTKTNSLNRLIQQASKTAVPDDDYHDITHDAPSLIGFGKYLFKTCRLFRVGLCSNIMFVFFVLPCASLLPACASFSLLLCVVVIQAIICKWNPHRSRAQPYEAVCWSPKPVHGHGPICWI